MSGLSEVASSYFARFSEDEIEYHTLHVLLLSPMVDPPAAH